MAIKFTNNASSKLTQALSANATSMHINAEDVSKFPILTSDDYCLLTLVGDNGNHEIIKTTAISSDGTCTIVRAQDSTTAKAWDIDTRVELRITAEYLNSTADNEEITSSITNIESDISDIKNEINNIVDSIPIDDVTITRSSTGKLQVEDIAIGGNKNDLASTSGLLGTLKYISGSNTDFNLDTDIFDEVLVSNSSSVNRGTFPDTGWWVVKQFNYHRYNSSRVQIGYRVFTSIIPKIFIRFYYAPNTTDVYSWSEWTEFITTKKIGDGITVNNGIISVPEYEGATASTAATSGLVPPAEAGQQSALLGGDGEWHATDGATIVQNSSGQLMTQDVAIGGNKNDLASARGLFNFLIVEDAAPDLNTFTKQGVYFFYASSASAGTNFPDTKGGTLVVYASRNQYLRQIYYSVTSSPRVLVRSGSATWWSEWSELLMSSRVGDGITVNEGIISVPEYEGATSSSTGTAGLVPPATSTERNNFLRGDGTWQQVDLSDYALKTELTKYLPLNGTAASATKLATARTICTNLSSTSSASFNGTANITPGITGILAVSHGGTGSSTEKYIQLSSISDSVTSTSSDTVASSNAVKQAYDKANSAVSAANEAQSTADTANSIAVEAKNMVEEANNNAITAQSICTGVAMYSNYRQFLGGMYEKNSRPCLPNYGTWRCAVWSYDSSQNSFSSEISELAGGSSVGGLTSVIIAIRIA